MQPLGMVRCSPLEECPQADTCARVLGKPQEGDRFQHFGPPKNGKPCNFYLKGKPQLPTPKDIKF